MIQKGERFPEFNLQDQYGKTWTLDELKGNPAVIYFYPKDDTSGCAKEAGEFRDSIGDFGEAQVLGVSPDSAASHEKFARKHDLNFPLLADPERQLIEQAGLWKEKSMYGRKYMGVQRATALLGPDGTVLEFWPDVKPGGHAAEVLSALRASGVPK